VRTAVVVLHHIDCEGSVAVMPAQAGIQKAEVTRQPNPYTRWEVALALQI
jgi:hypothetical protein